MFQVEVSDMKAAGKPGYVARINENRERQFLKEVSCSGHGASRQKLAFNLVEDGIYEICDANFGGRKRRVDFIIIKNGEKVFEADNLSQCERFEDGIDSSDFGWDRGFAERIVVSDCTVPEHKVEQAIKASYPGLKPESAATIAMCDVNVATFSENGNNRLRISMKSDAGFKYFLPVLKRVDYKLRKWNDMKKAWDISPDGVLQVRELIERYSVRAAENHCVELGFSITDEAKNIMGIEE